MIRPDVAPGEVPTPDDRTTAISKFISVFCVIRMLVSPILNHAVMPK
jgi:hypothetical protein